MLIEFAGLPGSGKTTLTASLVDKLTGSGESAYTDDQAVSLYNSRSEFGRSIAPHTSRELKVSLLGKYFAIQSPWHLYRFMRSFPDFWRIVHRNLKVTVGDERHQKLVRSYFRRAMLYYQYIDKHSSPRDIIVFDEGFTHRIIHFVSEKGAPEHDRIEEYMAFKPKMDVLVYLHVPEEICQERIQVRGYYGRLADMSASERADFFHHTNEVLEIGIQYLTETGKEVISIDAGEDISQVVDRLKSRILEKSEL